MWDSTQCMPGILMPPSESNSQLSRMNPTLVLRIRVGTALSQLALGHPDEASTTYHQLEKLGPDGVSVAQAGLADTMLYQGRTQDAIKTLVPGIDGDTANKNPDGMQL